MATICNVRLTELMAHIRDIQESAGSRQLDRWRCQCPANIDLTQASWFNAGPPSAMFGQHLSNTGKLAQCWATVCNVRPTLIQHRQIGSKLGHHLQCLASIDSTQASWSMIDHHMQCPGNIEPTFASWFRANKETARFLGRKKSTGLDEISPQFLRDAAPIVCAPLADIFNNSMLKGKIPQSWKNAKVTPIFKAGDPTDVSNYRPISVIPVIMKVLNGLCTINCLPIWMILNYYMNTNQALGINFPLRRHSSMLQNISSMGSTQENQSEP